MKRLSVCWLFLGMVLSPPALGAEAGPPQWLENVQTLSPPDHYCKYPALAFDASGVLWVAFTETAEDGDHLVVRRRQAGRWSPRQRIDSGEGVESGARLVITSAGLARVFWQGRRRGRWSVYTRLWDGSSWGPEERLSALSEDALHPRSVLDAAGGVWVMWEVARVGAFSLRLVRETGSGWSRPLPISSSGSDRRGVLAPRPGGGVFAAWDSTRTGNFDIFLARARVLSPHRTALDAPVQVTHHGDIDDSPSLATASDGPLWLAWNSMRGHHDAEFPTDRHAGDAYVRVWRDGVWLSPPAVQAGAPSGQVSFGMVNKTPRDAVPAYWHWKQTQTYPRVFVDGQDRAWIIWRTDATGAHNFDLWARVHDGTSWSSLLELTRFSPGRDEWPEAAVGPDGVLQLAWEGQVLPRPGEESRLSGGDVDLYNTRANPNVVLTGRLRAPADHFISAPLAALPPARPAAAGWEALLPGPPGRARTRDGRRRILFGDPHSHSILSDAKTGLPDQLLWLARDRLGLDYAVVSDHSEMGILQPSEFAELQLTAAAFSQPGRFISLSGWEWTAGVRYGHRVILHRDDGGPPLSSARSEGDTIEKLYAHVRQTGGVMSPHHSGQATWGRWNPDAHHDEELEPNFEIASWHGRVEFYGNPWEGRR
ncbi:MAG: hypothetical protein ACE5JX_14970, partial [Acidobacteriota bacterium]